MWALDGVPAEHPAGYTVVEPPSRGAPVAAAPVGPGDTAAILYTSGTTGPAKGVQCPHGQFYWWGILMGEVFELTEDDVLYTCLPLFHTNALNAFVQALVAGATFHLGPRFSASRFWTRVAEAGATVTYVLGAMVNILMSRPEGPEDRAHSVRVALAPATPPDLFDRFGERFGLQLLEGYGSTETNGALFSNWREQRAGFMGPAREGFEAIVADDEDGEVPDGVDGELLLRNGPPFAFATGYFGMPEKTVEAWRNLWFHTGDRVVREPDGWFRFVDRIKDTIRRRGENISSFEVEQALLSHPAVSAAAAFPVASEMAEDEVAAAVVLEDGAELTPEELMRHCEPRLAYFAIPRFLALRRRAAADRQRQGPQVGAARGGRARRRLGPRSRRLRAEALMACAEDKFAITATYRGVGRRGDGVRLHGGRAETGPLGARVGQPEGARRRRLHRPELVRRLRPLRPSGERPGAAAGRLLDRSLAGGADAAGRGPDPSRFLGRAR